jgi:hypothetical protein
VSWVHTHLPIQIDALNVDLVNIVMEMLVHYKKLAQLAHFVPL